MPTARWSTISSLKARRASCTSATRPLPAATSSLAIGKYIADDAEQRFDVFKPAVGV
jgi:hypothetical protein